MTLNIALDAMLPLPVAVPECRDSQCAIFVTVLRRDDTLTLHWMQCLPLPCGRGS